MDFNFFLTILINGLAIGAIYGLIAVGYTMVYGVLGLINFAHGDVFTIGAFIGLIAFMLALAIPSALPMALILIGVMVVAMIFTSVWNWAIELLAYRPLRGSFRLAPLITALGLSIALQNFIRINQGPRTKSMPDIITGGFTLPGTSVQIFNKQILVFVITALLLALFSYIVAKTPIGRAMRAVADNNALAQLKGINPKRVESVAIGLGAMLAGIGGVLLGIDTTVDPMLGFRVLLLIFAAAVLGGLGSIPGAVAGALVIGIAEEVSLLFVPAMYRGAIGFFAILLMLSFRPRGLFGERSV